MKPPDWTDKAGVVEWTLAQLRSRYGTNKRSSRVDQFALDVFQSVIRDDENAFVELVKDRSSAAFAFWLLRSVIEPAPRSTQTDFAIVGSYFVTFINEIWDEQFGRHQRRREQSPPLVYEIASRFMREMGYKVSAVAIERYRRKFGAP